MDILDLQKTFELNLEKAQFPDIPTMETRLAVDCSGSMSDEFRCGWVDLLIARFFVAAMKFDDNAELDVGGFNTDFTDFPSITELPENGYTTTYGMYADGGTSFAPVIKNMATLKPLSVIGFLSKITGVDRAKAYLGFLTDGENNDEREFEAMLERVDPTKTFIQLIAIGRNVNLNYLKAVAASYPFISLIHFPDPTSVSDNGFYEAICNEKLKTWIEATK